MAISIINAMESKAKVKTYKGWVKSGLDLDKYLATRFFQRDGDQVKEVFLNIPVEIDSDLVDYMRDIVPCYYCGETLMQCGDPVGSIPSYKKTREILTYDTISTVGNRHFWLGILPEMKL